MSEVSYAEMQEILNKANLHELPGLNICILRNITIEPVKPYIDYFAYQIGFNAHLEFGEYDNIFQEAVGGRGDLLNDNTDIVMVFMKLDSLSWDLARNFASMTASQIQSEANRIHELIASVLDGIRKQTAGMILWHSFETPIYPALGIYDRQVNDAQVSTVNQLNLCLQECLKSQGNAYLVDLNLPLVFLGAMNFYDNRYWHIGRAPYSRAALREIAKEDYKFIRALKGKNKKCLVLDCDNTLWGGVIGEDGFAGIQLGKTYPGSAYYEFQQEILNLYHRGIIISLCSKNNEEDVWDVFRKHPAMLIREEHIAAAQINWNDKVTNLRQIADDLNIGLDSMVFMDDSEFEINLIREALPEITAIRLEPKKATDYRDLLAGCGLFDALVISEEDRTRGSMYRAEGARKKLRSEVKDLDSYYKSLAMVLEIRFADEFSIPRIAQLTQKTNQFNLTTRRYSDEDIKSLANSDDSDVLYLRLQDKFGDSGIVGVCILRYVDRKSVMDTFLLSCRILGRGAEDAFLYQAERLGLKKGCKEAIGEFYSTKKNAQVENFYDKHGFERVGSSGSKADKCYRFVFEKGIPEEPAFFERIVSDITGDTSMRGQDAEKQGVQNIKSGYGGVS